MCPERVERHGEHRCFSPVPPFLLLVMGPLPLSYAPCHDGTVLLKPPLLALVFADDSLTIADFGLVTVTNSIPLRHDVPSVGHQHGYALQSTRSFHRTHQGTRESEEGRPDSLPGRLLFMADSKKDSISNYSDKGVMAGFKEFITRGNMIDMAVGVVMGTAVTTVVTAIVKSFINPLIAMIFGKPDMSKLLAFTVRGATVSFGAIINSLINFVAVAAAVYFFIIVPINKFHNAAKKLTHKNASDAVEAEEAAEEAGITPEDQTIALLTEIRDQLAQANTKSVVPSSTAAVLDDDGMDEHAAIHRG